jgi:hypothetical protein
MAKRNIRKQKKKGRGRPKKVGGLDPVVSARLPSEMVKKIDTWGEDKDAQSRQEAMKMLIAAHLAWEPFIEFLHQSPKPATREEIERYNKRALELQTQAIAKTREIYRA